MFSYQERTRFVQASQPARPPDSEWCMLPALLVTVDCEMPVSARVAVILARNHGSTRTHVQGDSGRVSALESTTLRSDVAGTRSARWISS
jgi:hypothetical protein